MKKEKRLMIEKTTRNVMTKFLKDEEIIKVFVETMFREFFPQAVMVTNSLMAHPDPTNPDKTVFQTLLETPEVSKYLSKEDENQEFVIAKDDTFVEFSFDDFDGFDDESGKKI